MISEFEQTVDFLSELSRKTTAYHDAPIDRIDDAREEYLEALRKFNQAQGCTNCTEFDASSSE